MEGDWETSFRFGTAMLFLSVLRLNSRWPIKNSPSSTSPLLVLLPERFKLLEVGLDEKDLRRLDFDREVLLLLKFEKKLFVRLLFGLLFFLLRVSYRSLFVLLLSGFFGDTVGETVGVMSSSTIDCVRVERLDSVSNLFEVLMEYSEFLSLLSPLCCCFCCTRLRWL